MLIFTVDLLPILREETNPITSRGSPDFLFFSSTAGGSLDFLFSGLQVHVWRQPGHCMVCSQLLLQVSFRNLALQDVCQKVSTYEPQWEKVCAINNVISDVATLLQFFSFRTLTTAPQNSLRLFLMTREWYLQDRFVSCSDMRQSLEMF